MSTVINMQDAAARDYVALATLKARLKIEVKTGLKHSGGSTLAIVNQKFGTSFKRKQQALEWVTARLDALRAANDAKMEEQA